MEIKFICNKCNNETFDKPINRNATCNICHKGRRRAFIKCPICNTWFKTDRYNKQFCSYPCKVKAQTTGRLSTRITITEARSAQSLLAYHVKKGHIIRPASCEECGKTGQRIEASHDDYSYPLEVRWLCRSCHRKWDKKHPKNVTVKLPLSQYTAPT